MTTTEIPFHKLEDSDNELVQQMLSATFDGVDFDATAQLAYYVTDFEIPMGIIRGYTIDWATHTVTEWTYYAERGFVFVS